MSSATKKHITLKLKKAQAIAVIDELENQWVLPPTKELIHALREAVGERTNE